MYVPSYPYTDRYFQEILYKTSGAPPAMDLLRDAADRLFGPDPKRLTETTRRAFSAFGDSPTPGAFVRGFQDFAKGPMGWGVDAEREALGVASAGLKAGAGSAYESLIEDRMSDRGKVSAPWALLHQALGGIGRAGLQAGQAARRIGGKAVDAASFLGKAGAHGAEFAGKKAWEMARPDLVGMAQGARAGAHWITPKVNRAGSALLAGTVGNPEFMERAPYMLPTNTSLPEMGRAAMTAASVAAPRLRRGVIGGGLNSLNASPTGMPDPISGTLDLVNQMWKGSSAKHSNLLELANQAALSLPMLRAVSRPAANAVQLGALRASNQLLANPQALAQAHRFVPTSTKPPELLRAAATAYQAFRPGASLATQGRRADRLLNSNPARAFARWDNAGAAPMPSAGRQWSVAGHSDPGPAFDAAQRGIGKLWDTLSGGFDG